jgi:DNA-binding transcriptional regulator of glucitol operon
VTATTPRRPASQAGARWAILLRPRWIAWHSFVVVATIGMLFLGDWQLHRAESGNELSWAYTFEWPLFAIFTVYFWIKSLRDELREHGAAADAEPGPLSAVPASGGAGILADRGAVATSTTPAPAPTASAGTAAREAAAVGTPRVAAAGRRADTWDATSWDATSWDATGAAVGADGAGNAADVARATPADGQAYVARLMAEVQGRRRGRRGGR